jgi:hypothetical protein
MCTFLRNTISLTHSHLETHVVVATNRPWSWRFQPPAVLHSSHMHRLFGYF